MAGKKKAAAKPKAKKAAKPRKQVRENPGLGHNAAKLAEDAVPFLERYLKLKEAMESDMAGYRSDINNLYEEAANELGLKKSVVSKELKRIEANKKAADKEKEMAADERQQTELFRSCFAGTPFEAFAEGDLAAPDEVEQANDEDHENAEEGE